MDRPMRRVFGVGRHHLYTHNLTRLHHFIAGLSRSDWPARSHAPAHPDGHPRSTKAPKLVTLVTTPSRIIPGFRSAISLTSSRHCGAANLSRGSRPGPAQFFADIAKRIHAHRLGWKASSSHFPIRSGLADQLRHATPSDCAIRSTPGTIPGCTAVMSSGFSPPRMRRKPAACSKVLGPKPDTAISSTRDRNRPCSFAVLHDLLRRALLDARHVAQQRPRRGVQIDAHAVHAGFHGGFQALHEPALIHVVLILARRRSTFGSIFTSSASGSCRRRAMEMAPRMVRSRSGNSWRAISEAE